VFHPSTACSFIVKDAGVPDFGSIINTLFWGVSVAALSATSRPWPSSPELIAT
jgi:hypothetical protein